MTVHAEHPGLLPDSDVDRLVRGLLQDQGFPEHTYVDIHFVTADEMAVHNVSAFGNDEPTDVLSFPVEDLRAGHVPPVDVDGPPLLLGDVFISPSVVAERADRNGFDPREEEALMVVHGLLHLLGHDHVDDAEADVMEAIEARVLAENGFGRR